MADEADIAQAITDDLIREGVNRVLRNTFTQTQTRCLNCGEKVAQNFCDRFCQEDYEKRSRLR